MRSGKTLGGYGSSGKHQGSCQRDNIILTTIFLLSWDVRNVRIQNTLIYIIYYYTKHFCRNNTEYVNYNGMLGCGFSSWTDASVTFVAILLRFLPIIHQLNVPNKFFEHYIMLPKILISTLTIYVFIVSQ